MGLSASKTGQFACAIVNDNGGSDKGQVYCWGLNTSGQLGNGDTSTPSAGTVVAVSTGAMPSSVKNIFAITAGEAHACAIRNEGTSSNVVYCWGSNTSGQLGNNSTTNSSVPVAVDSSQLGTNVLQIAAGANHTCALRSGGSVYCWGDNSTGQLGIGSTTSSQSPVEVADLASFGTVQIAAGANHTCALSSDFKVKCWGSGSGGQLGVGSTTTTDGSADDCNTLSGVTNVSFCKKSPPSSAINFLSPTGSAGSNQPTIVSLAAGGLHTCAMSIEGVSYCWGQNGFGQLGNSNTNQTTSPVYVCSGTGNCASGATSSTLTSPRPRMCSYYTIP